MKKISLKSMITLENVERITVAIAAVAALTGVMFLIGRDELGEGVIALLYLVPISWSTSRWGQAAGIAAALSAGLSFNFFFIPPFYTFYIESVEGWLLLAIFLLVAVVVVGRIQVGLARAQAREREAIFMYELSFGLSRAMTQQAAARLLAEQTQRVFQALLVEVFVAADENSFTVTFPPDRRHAARPDRVVPILSYKRMEGEIHLWKGELPLPDPANQLLQNFANQGALAFERSRLDQLPVENGVH